MIRNIIYNDFGVLSLKTNFSFTRERILWKMMTHTVWSVNYRAARDLTKRNFHLCFSGKKPQISGISSWLYVGLKILLIWSFSSFYIIDGKQCKTFQELVVTIFYFLNPFRSKLTTVTNQTASPRWCILSMLVHYHKIHAVWITIKPASLRSNFTFRVHITARWYYGIRYSIY